MQIQFGYKVIGILVFTLVFGLMSCNGTGDNEVNVEDMDAYDEDYYYGFRDFILSDYEIPAIIALPDESANIGASTKPEVLHAIADSKWVINIGQNFRMHIEDYADITNLVEVKKKEFADHKFFKIDYIENEKDLIVYKRTLVMKGSNDAPSDVGIEHVSYHVYGEKKVSGIIYELKSGEEGADRKTIELMAKSIRSFREIQAQ